MSASTRNSIDNRIQYQRIDYLNNQQPQTYLNSFPLTKNIYRPNSRLPKLSPANSPPNTSLFPRKQYQPTIDPLPSDPQQLHCLKSPRSQNNHSPIATLYKSRANLPRVPARRESEAPQRKKAPVEEDGGRARGRVETFSGQRRTFPASKTMAPGTMPRIVGAAGDYIIIA